MAERKAQQHYYPPDWDPSKGSLNTFQGQHPLRDRARKLHLGIMIIRFEMPFNVWCDTCNKMIGKGVRYNAEKKKVGNYYSTAIYRFTMKCHLCPGKLVIETDPKECDYKLVSGVRRKEERWEATDVGQIPLQDEEDALKLAADAMYRLEHNISDEQKGKEKKPDLQRLASLQARMNNDYDLNCALRREEKKVIKKAEAADADLLRRSSLAIDLLPERPEDRLHAALVAFNNKKSGDDIEQRKVAVKRRSIFALPAPPTPKTPGETAKRLKPNVTPEEEKKVRALRHTQHAAVLQHTIARPTSTSTLSAPLVIPKAPTMAPAIVDYPSDNDEA